MGQQHQMHGLSKKTTQNAVKDKLDEEKAGFVMTRLVSLMFLFHLVYGLGNFI